MTGLLSYYPSASQVGTQTIEVSVSDGGLSTTVSLSVNVLAASTDDLMGPRVRLRSPAVAPKASSVTAEALVEDTSAIASVEFLIGTQVALTLTEAPLHLYLPDLGGGGSDHAALGASDRCGRKPDHGLRAIDDY